MVARLIGRLEDPRLPLGALRELSESEVEMLLRSTRAAAPEGGRQQRRD